MNIGDKISALRKQNNMTQEDLANRLSVTPQAVSKWENNLTSPDISLLGAIASLFHITTDELLGLSAPKAYLAADGDISSLTLKIRVISHEGDKVNVNLPLSVIIMILESGTKFDFKGSDQLKDVDWKMITEAVKNGVRGKIVDVASADGDVVEIVVE